MWFWIFMFICNMLIPVMMLIFGRVMWKRPPKNINGVYGYRTKMSMKNMDTWKFAHEYCGKLWWKIGWILFVPSLIVQFPLIGKNDDIIGMASLVLCMIQCVVLITVIFPVEKALKKNFDVNGVKK